MRSLTPILLIALAFGCASRTDSKVAEDAFLRPYVGQLKKTTPPADLDKIKTMAESELILLLHGYGTGIRNQWLHGNRDPQLLRFFHDKGIDDPEAASMVIIQALWYDLNISLSPGERASVDKKRASVARKRANYERLESECEALLKRVKDEFERCYERNGPPSKNPVNREPFFQLLVGKTGHVREIVFFEGASADLKECLEKIIMQFTFSAFTDDEQVTLYILEFPRCRIAERDTLHSSISSPNFPAGGNASFAGPLAIGHARPGVPHLYER